MPPLDLGHWNSTVRIELHGWRWPDWHEARMPTGAVQLQIARVDAWLLAGGCWSGCWLLVAELVVPESQVPLRGLRSGSVLRNLRAPPHDVSLRRRGAVQGRCWAGAVVHGLWPLPAIHRCGACSQQALGLVRTKGPRHYYYSNVLAFRPPSRGAEAEDQASVSRHRCHWKGTGFGAERRGATPGQARSPSHCSPRA